MVCSELLTGGAAPLSGNTSSHAAAGLAEVSSFEAGVFEGLPSGATGSVDPEGRSELTLVGRLLDESLGFGVSIPMVSGWMKSLKVARIARRKFKHSNAPENSNT